MHFINLRTVTNPDSAFSSSLLQNTNLAISTSSYNLAGYLHWCQLTALPNLQALLLSPGTISSNFACWSRFDSLFCLICLGLECLLKEAQKSSEASLSSTAYRLKQQELQYCCWSTDVRSSVQCDYLGQLCDCICIHGGHIHITLPWANPLQHSTRTKYQLWGTEER